ncbi:MULTISPECIES: hypothetical protein [Bacteria]|uniref:Uncharacterized protein n=3 Tax=Bacteria TaxID=2 RepID=A0AAU9AIG8_LYSEN|nr:hypothetical protein [Lysobacter enzymogenes]EDN84188.1 hypothetical protein BIFADO_00011 [Bifidobacterium adolescentis L2-32]BAV95934.1 conserved hypothetical protein [Lysobacter enzymogenes]
MDRTALNEAKSLVYRDARVALIELRKLEIQIAQLDHLSEKVRTLRTTDLKKVREYRQAAIFCYGMSLDLERNVRFCPTDRSDHDFIATWQADDTHHFVPVQLKELVPEELNKTLTLERLVDSLSKYKASPDLTVAIFLNREGRFDPSAFQIPSTVDVAGVWLVSNIGTDKWRIIGDFINQVRVIDFDYPQA